MNSLVSFVFPPLPLFSFASLLRGFVAQLCFLSLLGCVSADSFPVTVLWEAFIPTSLAFGAADALYATDSNSKTVMKINTTTGMVMQRYNTTDSSSYPSDSGPLYVAVAPSGAIVIVDEDNTRVVELHEDGRLYRTFNSTCRQQRDDRVTTGLAIDWKGDLLVADYMQSTIIELAFDGGGSLTIRNVTTPPLYTLSFAVPDATLLIVLTGHSLITYRNNSLISQVNLTGNVYSYIAVDGLYNIYLTGANGRSDVLKLDFNGTLLQRFSAIPSWSHPAGVAVDKRGRLHTADTWNQRVVQSSAQGEQLAVFNLSKAFIQQPVGVAVDGVGNILVADWNGGQLVALSPSGEALGNIFTYPGNYHQPQGVVVATDGSVYLSDVGYKAVYKRSPDGQWSALNTTAAMLNGPRGIAMDSAGFLYLVDMYNARVVKLSTSGTLLAEFNTSNPVLNPWGVAVDSSYNLYVTDTNRPRVVKLSPTNELLKAFTHLRWASVRGVAVNQLGQIFVSDSFSKCVVQLAADGTQMAILEMPQQPLWADGLALDREGNLLVADMNHFRIVRFNMSGGDAQPFSSSSSFLTTPSSSPSVAVSSSASHPSFSSTGPSSSSDSPSVFSSGHLTNLIVASSSGNSGMDESNTASVDTWSSLLSHTVIVAILIVTATLVMMIACVMMALRGRRRTTTATEDGELNQHLMVS